MNRIAALVVALATAVGTIADEHPDQGQWLLSLSASRTEVPMNDGLGHATAPSLALGYSLTDRLAAEVSYSSWEAARGEGDTSWLSGIWSLPRTPDLQPYVVFGGGVADVATDGGDDSLAQWFGGVGVFGDLGSHLAWRVDVRAVKTESSSSTDGYAQAGVTFLLGDASASVRDADGDGVPDARDACPDTSLGVTVDVRGCRLAPPDDDGDGVPNADDECPATPSGQRVDSRGCQLDDDADGVADMSDECPHTPGGTRVDAAGCPLSVLDGTWIDAAGQPLTRNADGVWLDSTGQPVAQNADGVWVDADGRPVAQQSGGIWVDSEGHPIALVVLFDFDSAELGSRYVRIVRNHAAYLRANGTWSVRVEGHADAKGTNAYNLALGERRARAVRDALLTAGVEPGRISLVSYGEDRPITDADDAANRRTVVIYIE